MKNNLTAAILFLAVVLLPLHVTNAAAARRLTAEEAIKIMALEPMPGRCGGYFREIFRSACEAKKDEPRSCGSMIYHLIAGDYTVPFHKITSDEIFTYLAGDPQSMLLVYPDGRVEEVKLGNKLAGGETPLKVVPAGVWMAEVIKNSKKSSWSLISVTVVPGFDAKDYAHSKAEDIIRLFPKTEKLIKELGLDKE